jgi:phosphate transport system protein
MLDSNVCANTVEECRKLVYEMSELVISAFNSSVDSFFYKDAMLAQNVIASDKSINAREIALDNATFKILAMNHPEGEELRYVLSIQKITVILERIGDHAVNIAESSISLQGDETHSSLFDMSTMATVVKEMLTGAVKSFLERNIAVANQVLRLEQKADELNITISDDVKSQALRGTIQFDTAMEIIRICKNLERIADLSTNISEEVCFMVSGAIAKHMDITGKREVPDYADKQYSRDAGVLVTD